MENKHKNTIPSKAEFLLLLLLLGITSSCLSHDLILTKCQKRILKKDAEKIKHSFNGNMFSALKYVLRYGRYSIDEHGKSLYD